LFSDPRDDDDASTIAEGMKIAAIEEPAETVVVADPWKDAGSLFVLLVLYTLQGVPMGLASAIPVLLQSRGFGFGAKAVFSIAAWPYSVKLLWSPIVDAVYSDSVGRRKSWVLPVQIMTGVVMIVLGSRIDEELGPGSAPDLWRLTFAFLFLYFLVATQDIAVDGWALTMLRPENVGFASVCNSVGQTTGYILAYALTLALGDADFCDNYLRAAGAATGTPLVTLGELMLFWGIMFVVVTVLVGLFKQEAPADLDIERTRSGGVPNHSCGAAGAAVWESYKAGWTVLMLPNVQKLLVVLLTSRLAFAAVDSALDIELLQKGVPKMMILNIGLIYTPFEIAFSLLASTWTAGGKPMNVWTSTYPVRVILCLVLLGIISIAPDLVAGDKADHSWQWYSMVIAAFVAIRLCSNVMFVSQMAFYNRIADPAIGGTYMTILNTITNLGGMWPGPLVLSAIELLEQTGCYVGDGAAALRDHPNSMYLLNTLHGTEMQPLPVGADGQHLTCLTKAGAQACKTMGGHCTHQADGFLLVGLACGAVGLIWYAWFYPMLVHVQELPTSGWRVVAAKESTTRT
jgi:PAT family acetyl-CoA transporter-like MFS transporter 1